MHIPSIFNLMFWKNNARGHELINIEITNIAPVNHSKFLKG